MILLLGTAIAFAQSQLDPYLTSVDAVVQARAFEALITHGLATPEQLKQGWSASDLAVRERVSTTLFEMKNVAGLQQGWKAEISDQERCRLALRLSTMDQKEEMIAAASAPIEHGASWPVFSKGTIEDQWTCAIAAAVLISVDAPLNALLKRGDFPLSMPFVQDVYTFGTPTLIQKVIPEMEWAEEGIRAPLWTAMYLNTPSPVQDPYLEALEEWSVGECLDAVEVAWMVSGLGGSTAQEIKTVLNVLKKHSPLCRDWAQLAKFAVQDRLPRSVLRRSVDIRAEKDEVLGTMRLIVAQQQVTKHERRLVLKYVPELMAQDLDTSVLIEVLRGVPLWSDGEQIDTLERLQSLKASTMDPLVLLEITIAEQGVQQKLN